MSLEPEFCEERKKIFDHKKLKLKNNWIRKMKNLDPDDAYYDVVFTDEPQLHGNYKL